MLGGSPLESILEQIERAKRGRSTSGGIRFSYALPRIGLIVLVARALPWLALWWTERDSA